MIPGFEVLSVTFHIYLFQLLQRTCFSKKVEKWTLDIREPGGLENAPHASLSCTPLAGFNDKSWESTMSFPWLINDFIKLPTGKHIDLNQNAEHLIYFDSILSTTGWASGPVATKQEIKQCWASNSMETLLIFYGTNLQKSSAFCLADLLIVLLWKGWWAVVPMSGWRGSRWMTWVGGAYNITKVHKLVWRAGHVHQQNSSNELIWHH